MATKVKPTRLNVTGTPQAGDVPMYVDADSFEWGAGGGGSGDVVGPASSTDGHLAVFDGATGKLIKDGGSVPTSFSPDSAGTQGQVLTKGASGYDWATVSGGDVQVSTDTGNLLTTGVKLWLGDKADFDDLGSLDANTIYAPIVGMGGGLPDTYQEVEYIQSSGTQYMVIGTSFKTNYKVVIDFQMTVTGGDQVPIGIHYTNGGINVRFGINAYNSYIKVDGGGDRTNTIAEDTNRHVITIDTNAVIVDGANYTTNYTNYTFSQGIGVFCYNEYHLTPPYTCKSSNRLYKLDIYDEGGNHIHDLVPCYRIADSVIGLYDLVNDVFYTNNGTGVFTKGNDVS